MLAKFSNQVLLPELENVQNVALVTVTATVPANGAREGDRIDAFITSIGAASSLRGGRLFVTPLLGPTAEMAAPGVPFALVEGPILLEDTSTPTVGMIKQGAVMEVALAPELIRNGQFTLVLDESAASWTAASTIAKVINDSEDMPLAVAIDPKNLVVTIPPMERERPDSFISRVQRLPVPMLPTEARVQVNDRTGTIVMTGDVEISPVVISHKGLTISTIRPEPVPTPRLPVIDTKTAIALDTTNSGGSKLKDLVGALDALKVPAEDRIAIIKELHKTGKLHAKLIVE
jgi:flagellar P-ring protein precursor FlgI